VAREFGRIGRGDGLHEGETTTVVEDQLVTSLAPVVGVSFEPVDDWHMGLVWRDEHESKVDLKIRVASWVHSSCRI
jgi:hypothetical protein